MLMKIATLNLGHRARRPGHVPNDLLDALLGVKADLLFLTEYVNTPEYETALRTRWAHVEMSEQLPYNARGLWSNQVTALSKEPLLVLPGIPADPDQDAATNYLCVKAGELTVTGLRAPAYQKAAVWYGYWEALGKHLHGDIVIGDLNADPSRGGKHDRVIPDGWSVVTPPGGGPSYRSLTNSTSSTLDHALVRPGIDVIAAEYRPEFFGKWGLDHCPLVVQISRSAA
jgi:hypothetical protein